MGRLVGTLLLAAFFFFIAAVISTFIIKIAWVYSMTPMFGLAEPTWTQAFALSVLCGSLFGRGFSASSKSS